MSQEHDPSSPEGAATEGIHTVASPFEPSYQPETLPKISVPDLAEDAQGMTAEALAQIPTLTEEATSQDVVDAPIDQPEVTDEHSADEPAEPSVAQAEVIHPEADVAPIQDTPAQADTWGEVLHARMGKLTDDIHTLNTRLDRLEERNKTKV